MWTDIILTLITLAVAVIGCLAKDGQVVDLKGIGKTTDGKIRVGLLSCAVLASGASIFKAVDDDRDKRFIQKAITANLQPSTPFYDKLADIVDGIAGESNTSLIQNYHFEDGTVFFIGYKGKDGHVSVSSVVVLDQPEVSEVFSDALANETTKIAPLIHEKAREVFYPWRLTQDFENRVGLLMEATLVWHLQMSEVDYHYDDIRGVVVTGRTGSGAPVKLSLSASDLAALPSEEAGPLFTQIYYSVMTLAKIQ